MESHQSLRTETEKRPVYLDVCALGRPLDVQTQIRIRLEADAVHLILSHVLAGAVRLLVSPAHDIEVRANPDPGARDLLLFTLRMIGEHPVFDREQVRARAEELVQKGMGPADAAHLAFAEAAEADSVTCDDRLIRQSKRIGATVWTGDPIEYCAKEDLR